VRVQYQTVVPALGYKLIAVLGTGRDLIEQSWRHQPDVVIADCHLPDLGGVAAAEEICRARLVPVIATGDLPEWQQIKVSGAEHVWACLVKPINGEQLATVIALAVRRFKEMEARFQELQSLLLEANSTLAFV
jgi:response regulator NasT